MSHDRGFIGPDGRSNVPLGVVDTSLGAEDAKLSEIAAKKLEAFMKGLDAETVKAKYKLEVVFTKRSTMTPFFGLVSAFSNGGFNHGGGDECIYFCTAKIEKDGNTRTCSGPLDLRFVGGRIAICPKCKQATPPQDLAGQIGYRATLQDWGKIIYRIWMQLEGDADIRMGLLGSGGSLRDKTGDVLNRTSLSAGDKLDVTREKREWANYPLRNIIKDTSAGANLEKRISAFLGS